MPAKSDFVHSMSYDVKIDRLSRTVPLFFPYSSYKVVVS